MRRSFPALLLALSLAVAACGGSGQPSGSGASNGPSVDPSPSGSASSRGSGSQGADPSPTGGTSGPNDPAVYAGPGYGTYRYTTSIDLGPEGHRDGTRVISYYRARGDQVVVRQITQIKDSDEREWWFRFAWAEDGLRRITDVNPSSGLCTFDRPLLELQLPVAVGQFFRSEGMCAEQDTLWRLEVNVVGTQTIRVAGEDVEAFVVERKLWRSSPGAETQPLLETYWFDPVSRLYVRMRTRGVGAPLDLVDRLNSREPETSPEATPPRGV